MAILGFLCWFVPYAIVGHRDFYTCVVCRAERIDHIYFNRTWRSDHRETKCTVWYGANVELHHEHLWTRMPDTTFRNLYGQPVAGMHYSERPGRAIWMLHPEQQQAIYEHLPNTLEGRHIFARLMDPSLMHSKEDFAIVLALDAWHSSGFKDELRLPGKN